MKKKQRKVQPHAPAEMQRDNRPWYARAWVLWTAFAVATLIFYWTPLLDSQASIQWDAVDVHYSAQKYFEQSLRSGSLPLWTPFEYSGMPFLADPQTAGWYPLHWPFFLIGITPRAIEWELALHAFLALAGAFLLARRFTDNTGAAILAGILYAGSGFFAGHSSHVGMFETAALFPWLLWAADRALDAGRLPDVVTRSMLAGSIGGLLILAGHFQTALYSFFGLLLFVIARRRNWRRSVLALALTGAIAFCLSAIQTFPGLQLTAQSVRATADFRTETNSALIPGALATLVSPDHYGVLSGSYHGPADITQFYFYGGLLLIPLAALALAGSKARRRLIVPLALIVPAIWYALGPGTGLYSVLASLPGFANVRAPVHIWFVAALGLALAAAQGALWISERFRQPWILAVLIVVSLGDLWHFNMSANPLAYGRASFDELYGNAYGRYQSAIAGITARPLSRLWSPFVSNSVGPLNSAIEGRNEVSYGYNPLELERYAAYVRAVEGNARLLNGLAITHVLNPKSGAISVNPDALPRAYAPPNIQFAADETEARKLLATLDPARTAIVEAEPRTIAPQPAKIEITGYGDRFYRIHYNAPAACLLRIAVPYFPAWIAQVDEEAASIVPVDVALMGVFVPAGDHVLELRDRSGWFAAGAALTALTLLILGFFGWRSGFWKHAR